MRELKVFSKGFYFFDLQNLSYTIFFIYLCMVEVWYSDLQLLIQNMVGFSITRYKTGLIVLDKS